MRHLRHAITRARRHAHALREWARWVIRRLTREPGYLEAVADLAVAIAELFCRSHAVRHLVREAAHTIVLVLRALLAPEGPGHSAPHGRALDDGDLTWA